LAGFGAGFVVFPWIRGLDWLGFPWNLSSETGLFKELRALSGGRFLSGPLPHNSHAPICQNFAAARFEWTTGCDPDAS
jgi:hypothetical protein